MWWSGGVEREGKGRMLRERLEGWMCYCLGEYETCYEQGMELRYGTMVDCEN